MNGVATSFLSVGEQEIAEHDAAGVLVRRFVWGAGLDDLVATIGTTHRGPPLLYGSAG